MNANKIISESIINYLPTCWRSEFNGYVVRSSTSESCKDILLGGIVGAVIQFIP